MVSDMQLMKEDMSNQKWEERARQSWVFQLSLGGAGEVEPGLQEERGEGMRRTNTRTIWAFLYVSPENYSP
jgi:hypothetical protein